MSKLTTFYNIEQYNKKYYPKTFTIEKCIQKEFDDAIYSGDIKKAVTIIINFNFNKLVNLLKLKLVAHF